jgi:hypothetical protein
MADEAQVRIGHCSPDAPSVDVRVDGETAFEDVAFEQITDYAALAAGDHAVAILPHGTDEAVLEVSIDLDENTHYTVLATGMAGEGDLEATILVDEPGDVPDDRTHLRFVHGSPDAPAVDVRVVGGPTLFESVGFRASAGYDPVDAGTYDVEAVPTGTDDVALSLPGIEFEGGTAVTAVAVGRVADDSLTAILTEDARKAMPADD